LQGITLKLQNGTARLQNKGMPSHSSTLDGVSQVAKVLQRISKKLQGGSKRQLTREMLMPGSVSMM
jgi:hypothetical protein